MYHLEGGVVGSSEIQLIDCCLMSNTWWEQTNYSLQTINHV
jgi:hypothetical protein